MSIVLITQHDENIYDAIVLPTDLSVDDEVDDYEEESYKRVSRVRKHPKKPPHQHATMGLAHVAPPDPANYLKKGSHKPPIKSSDKPHPKTRIIRIPEVPRRVETLKKQDEVLKWKPKNMIKRNIQYVIEMVPKVPERRTVIDRKGSVKPLKPSLEPTFLPSPAYGNLPKFLDTIMKLKEKERVKGLALQTNKKSQTICHYLTRDRRNDLLNGLKENWAEMQGQYSLLPIQTDTIPKKNRKSKLESDLKQLEKDVVLIERHPYIYIYPDEIPDDDNEQEDVQKKE